MVEKLVQAFILPIDKKMVEKMELYEVTIQFFHAFLLSFISYVIEALACYHCRCW